MRGDMVEVPHTGEGQLVHRGTSRLVAFSDGVFAITITLLVQAALWPS